MIAASEIERMTGAEKLQTMELLWRSLASQPDKVQSPEWHRTVLEERLVEMDSGQAKFLTIDELKARLAKRA